MKYKGKTIIFSDLDGTALFNDDIFSEKTKAIIEECYKNDIYFIPITARSTMDVIDKCKVLKIDQFGGIGVANNGSQIYDFKNNQWIKNVFLEKELVTEIFDQYYNTFLAKAAFIADKVNYSFAPSKNIEYWSKISNMGFEVVTNARHITEPISHITLIWKKDLDPKIKEEELEKLKTKFGKRTLITVYNDRVVELSVLNTTKGTAVEEIVKYLNLDDDVKVYAFGDGSNDISMFKNVKYGIAMKNGLDELKEIAYDVTDFSNTEDGVVEYILKNILV